ncbi:protein-glutamine gamma-glutamyltransferase K [Elysia marginata]|uniref:Protein-glutamine gamma-glutamyltransferase K n=1 Tax=Elysia marginata TaxID=1093978 RepID=A0AAV4F7P8_9GAST|nr:protein-glutamine gamma-glutamyltransferase K [Elysia marginata]
MFQPMYNIFCGQVYSAVAQPRSRRSGREMSTCHMMAALSLQRSTQIGCPGCPTLQEDWSVWTSKNMSTFYLLLCFRIGKHVSTKAANSVEREDVSDNYKPEEGSAEERASVLRANQLGSNRPGIYKKEEDVHFSLEHDPQNTWVGSDFDVALRIRNTSPQVRTIKGRMVVSTMYYTGQLADQLRVEPFERIKLDPGQDTQIKVKVTSQEYDGKLKDCCMLDMSVWASVEESGQVYTAKPTFRLRKPHLTVKAPKVVSAGAEFEVEVSFPNPLATTLTGCYIEVDGLTKPLKFRLGNVTPRGTFMTSLPIVPKKVGPTTLIVVFNSDQLEDINASLTVFIKAV